MQGRWWDSEAALDALDLVDGSDPAMGVSVAVLGYHAIAKQAIAPLGAQTLVDVSHLERAFETADFTEVAEAVHAATCEALGHEAACRYAQAAVEDWTQRSKAAAGRLTRALVNKGLPWPTAVQRAAEVAGVPLVRLGRYATVAADRQVGELGLMDAADRVLMEYAHYRGAMESDLVAKSGGRVRHRMQERKWDESEVNRDEAGRFAVEAHAVTDEEKALRAKRREERRLRRERRARKERRSSTSGSGSPVRDPGSSTARMREASAERSERTPVDRASVRVQRQSVDRPPTGVMDSKMVRSDDVPDYRFNEVPVTVTEPLFVVQYETEDGPKLTPAFVEADSVAVAEAVTSYFIPAQTAVKVMRFPPGGLLIAGSRPDLKGDWNQRVGFGLSAAPMQWLAPDDQTGFALRIPNPKPYHAEGFRNAEGLKVSVPFVDAEMVEKIEPGSWKTVTKSGRVRYRTAQREPWVESEVARDRLGRFAVEAEAKTDEERAERARRREERQKRRQRRERRARAASARVAAAEGVQQRERDAVSQRREREAPNQRVAQRAEHRRVAQREGDPGPAEWIGMLTNPILTEMNLSSLIQAGLTADVEQRPIHLAEMLDVVTDSVERGTQDRSQEFAGQVMQKYTLHTEYRMRDADGNVRDSWSADRVPDENTAVTLLNFHMMLDALTTKERGSNMQVPFPSPDEAYAATLDLVANEMYVAGRDALDRRHSPFVVQVEPEAETVAIGRMSGLWFDTPAVLLGREKVGPTAWTGMPHAPNRAYVLRDPAVNEHLALLADFTAPRNTKVGARLYLKAREQIADELNTDPAAADDLELLNKYLEMMGVSIEQMPSEFILDMGREALSMYRDGPVRLDGIDVFCIR